MGFAPVEMKKIFASQKEMQLLQRHKLKNRSSWKLDGNII